MFVGVDLMGTEDRYRGKEDRLYDFVIDNHRNAGDRHQAGKQSKESSVVHFRIPFSDCLKMCK